MESNRKLEEFYFDKHNILSALNAHITFLYSWIKNTPYQHFASNDLYDKGVTRSLGLSLQLDAIPDVVDAYAILNNDQNYLIYGGAGLGKTTLLKSYVQRLLNNQSDNRLVPIVIISQTLLAISLTEALKDIFNIRSIDQTNQNDLEGLRKILSENKFVIFIDGLDEMITKDQELLQDELLSLAATLDSTKFIVTTRPYSKFLENGFQIAELLPLNFSQVSEFIVASFVGNDFINVIEGTNYYDLLQNPSLANLLIDVYKRLGHLPKNSINIYKTITRTLLEQFDQRIKSQIKLPFFDIDSLADTLDYIAFRTILDHRSTFTLENLNIYLNQAYPRFNIQSADDRFALIDLLTQSNFLIKTGENTFQFVHRSLVEYFAATYLVKLPNLNVRDAMNDFPEVLAICVLLSSDQFYYFSNILNGLKLDGDTQKHLMQFARKLLQEASNVQREIFIKSFDKLQPQFDRAIELEFEILKRYFV